MSKYRSHNCNALRKKNVGNDVLLSGWINKKRDHGNILFIDLRDNYGITQCIIDKKNPQFNELEKIQLETVIKIDGNVVNRSVETINNEIDTGEIEVSIKSFCPEKTFAVEAVIDVVVQLEVVTDRGYQSVPSVANKTLLPGAIT